MKRARILFQDPDPRVLRIAERALLATGCEVELVLAGQVSHTWASAQASGGGRASESTPAPAGLDAPELLRRIRAGGYDLVFLNFDPAARADPRWAEVWEALGDEQRVVLHTTAPSDDYQPLFGDGQERRFVRNLIARAGEALEPEELLATAAKLLGGDLFGLEKYMLWGVSPLRLEIRDSREKHAYVREVASFAERLGCGDRTVALVETIADELITNAIYHAPRDERGRPRYASLPRRQPVVLEPHEAGRLDIASDGITLAIAQSDPFGSLAQDTLVTYLNRCLVQRAPLREASFGPGAGAGIGLARVFQSLSRFIVNVDPGRRTEVIALIDLRVPMKKFRQMPRSFHIFMSPEPRRG